MAKREIIWSLKAKNDRIKILEFWIENNKSVLYSRKLNSLFKDAVKFISEYPTVGKLTEDKKARIKIVRDYLIIYEVHKTVIVILTIFDSRRNPDNLKK
ncbi:type II toxin-antitoxin system RelE/ParE family toxin [Flavobacterium sp. CYK-55]|jgi:toxin YoeB|uniref:type II toxin-antitoxin system RelE/ParE family toxin n=1 Tax=Flavobacterium sp. CYK-55 TaxID=2835529 RepID=UPI001BCACBEB|nr:type II toxin-antitoxin system RelE/ParE family toxin [Flavobacterium sp. CYK-55]MBS7787670.1 type II toxin-antitoxin system RelE/ParE family toxin [Flavobacterium sp. CYK-55]